MPLYEYQCLVCKEKIEVFEGMNKHSGICPKCPKCGKATERVFSSFAFSMNGFYEPHGLRLGNDHFGE